MRRLKYALALVTIVTTCTFLISFLYIIRRIFAARENRGKNNEIGEILELL